MSPTIEILEAVCRWRRQSLEWLLFGDEGEAALVAEPQEPYARKRRRALPLPVVGRMVVDAKHEVVWEPVEASEWQSLPANAALIDVRSDALRPLALPGQKLVAAQEQPSDGDLVAVELKDGRQLLRRWWAQKGGRVVLESARSDQPEPPVVERRSNIRRVLRIVGVLF